MSDCTPLKFPVAQIRDNRGLSASLTIPASSLFIEPLPEAVHAGDVAAALDFSIGGSSILLEARIAGAWTVACSRCLTLHDAPYEAQFDETFPLTDETIDVSGPLREAALLEIPQRSLCRPDCPIPWGNDGREPGQPAPEPTSSPFDALKKFKEN
ncbi:MAG: hypothetical protein AUJ52_11055 [Elusimicrobia bacterium CG1_02_63_36]|nr:MAG: hypothetical protein AUJ52_11055 [Elusimicrobia bacterium CG1_02_63_36]PIP81745.1 MAG: hypothetical protein COR54_18460 [Elusimicrobia bacterium CG22_combo_CG10-13_8_21_14_all_63_91]PJA18048.1 MAG: hypothetical protein COX66_02490 [Elusimicrobia bacterium CG_4_10_14_0_2_um_filter_63_34]PJB23904.1 MAG: hypothetical protein CO113_16400 [Elusimicrobia bacterium CG_4_9_14_3_um_filter_62_55]